MQCEVSMGVCVREGMMYGVVEVCVMVTFNPSATGVLQGIQEHLPG